MKNAANCRFLLPLVMLSLFCAGAAAQDHAPHSVPAVLLSDIHFDPLHDPAKFAQLDAAPVSNWEKILASPDSPTEASDFASLQKSCGARDVDTDWALLASALQAARARQPAPLFVTLSGDLLVHQFDCRFHTLAPAAGASADAAFAEKVVAFVALELRQAFPGVPVYIGFGNNDSGCGDFRETPDSAFLRALAPVIAGDVDAANRDTVLREFPQMGDYDVALPHPMEKSRLIVLQNIFQSYRYQTCDGADDRTAAKTQVAWLAGRLAQARSRGEHVWVMMHIPTGANPYTTFAGKRNVCGGQPPSMFQSSNALADTLVRYADVVRLVIMGHTHNDEIRLLQPGSEAQAGSGGMIPGKLVPAISPVHGNNPAFVVATINPRSSVLVDYSVFAGSNQTGIGTQWAREYTWSEAYGLPDFSAASVQRLMQRFAQDGQGLTASSRDYQRWYSVDDTVRDKELSRIWPAYVCSMSNDHAVDLRRCVCSGQAPGKQ